MTVDIYLTNYENFVMAKASLPKIPNIFSEYFDQFSWIFHFLLNFRWSTCLCNNCSVWSSGSTFGFSWIKLLGRWRIRSNKRFLERKRCSHFWCTATHLDQSYQSCNRRNQSQLFYDFLGRIGSNQRWDNPNLCHECKFCSSLEKSRKFPWERRRHEMCGKLTFWSTFFHHL